MAFALLGAGCSLSTPGGHQASAQIKLVFPEMTPEQLRQLAAQASTACATSDCDAAVGMLVGVEEKSVRVCTAFLVAPDKVMTAGRCLSSRIARGGEGCEDVTILFPAADSQGEPERAQCSKVIAVSRPAARDQVAPDYALLALKSATRRPALSPGAVSGAAASSSIVAVDVVRNGRGLLGRQRRKPCAPRGLRTAMLALSGCNLEPGNSGAPVLTADRTAWAVVSSGPAPSFASTLSCIPEIVPGVRCEPAAASESPAPSER
jgi:V8-like Glu-specific endopeptidase